MIRNSDLIFLHTVSFLPGIKALMAPVSPVSMSVTQVDGQVEQFPYKTVIAKEEEEGRKRMEMKERGGGDRGKSPWGGGGGTEGGRGEDGRGRKREERDKEGKRRERKKDHTGRTGRGRRKREGKEVGGRPLNVSAEHKTTLD